MGGAALTDLVRWVAGELGRVAVHASGWLDACEKETSKELGCLSWPWLSLLEEGTEDGWGFSVA
jgi:hypothetical protein